MFKEITDKFTHKFTVPKDGLYSITVEASCKTGKFLGLFGRQNLGLRIDDTEHMTATWRGSRLKGLSQKIIFISQLKAGEHSTNFSAQKGATLKKDPQVNLLNSEQITLTLNEQAQDGNRRPWVSIILINVGLKSVEASTICEKHPRDSDDVKIIINNDVQKTYQSGWWGKNWYWQGRKLLGRTEETKFYTNLNRGTHHIEFWADRTPTLNWIKLDLVTDKHQLEEQKRIPTVDDPSWTGEFKDDPEKILLARLIFGEAENQSRECKIWVGSAVVNRVGAKAWRNTLHDVITQKGQYDPFKESDRTHGKVIDPLKNAAQSTKAAWYESYEVAQGLLSGKITNPTDATHFHGTGITRDWFMTNIVPNGRFIRQIDNTSFYWSPN